MLRLYFDEDAGRRMLVQPLRDSSMDAITTTDAGNLGSSDEEQLAFAASHGRVLVTQNVQDFYRIHIAWLTLGRSHAGMILIHQERLSVGECIRRLLRVCAERTPETMRDRAEFLSSWG